MATKNPTPRIEIEGNERWEPASRDYFIPRFSRPAAYIVTNNRGKRYLVFADSVEHENAVMFGYEIKPLYE